jgi:hypothetical protein
MIDTTSSFLPATKSLLSALSDEARLHKLGLKLYNGHTIYLRHPFGYESIQFRIYWERGQLFMRTSLPKLLQGHNVFGSNSVEYLCMEAIDFLYESLGIPLTAKERAAILAKRIGLTRIDLTVSFFMPSQLMVPEVIEAVYDHFRAQGLKWSAYGQDDFETTYLGQRSTRLTWKFYNKYAELMVNKIPADLPNRDPIIEYARNLVRFELTLRGKELRRIGMMYADLWTPEKVRETIIRRLDSLELQGVIRERLPLRYIEGLNKACQTFHDLWAEGCDLRRHRHYAPLSRARREILRKNRVDIFRCRGTGSDIALEDLLTEENAYFVGPKALVKSGAIWLPTLARQ